MPIPPDETSRESTYHTPVLVETVRELLRDARTVLDGTAGGGGHTRALLAGGAHVTALDRDPQAVGAVRERLADAERAGRLRVVQGNFADAGAANALGGGCFDGVLLDLGVSSHQIDRDERGFSFRRGVPLDMRMGPDAPRTAAELLAGASERELAQLFRDYADEPRAQRLARTIVARRRDQPFQTSDDLVRAIRAALGARSGPADFARLFQAVRMAVNEEMDALAAALPLWRDRLCPGGVLVVIAYHSGEDRMVKHAFRDWSAACICPPEQPVCTCRGVPLGTVVTRRPVRPAPPEVESNPRARSARLRAWRRAA
ncbi:MAG TPA: 16S rRNA (cytosine(1402)-N(4))-methyltransferase RsmH [Gemmatimonadaceae bacterium]|nr:16S rRNA (cytosine(1402)-N(4))-methyltransferase RsmH [Gemmatimonadaceae bacterium]